MVDTKKNKKEDKRLRCEKCGSRYGYLATTKGVFRCRSCGHETKVEEEE